MVQVNENLTSAVSIIPQIQHPITENLTVSKKVAAPMPRIRKSDGICELNVFTSQVQISLFGSLHHCHPGEDNKTVMPRITMPEGSAVPFVWTSIKGRIPL